MKKILLVSPFFYPEKISSGLFNTKIVKALERKNCLVDVWCSHPFYPLWRPQYSDNNDIGNNVKRMGSWIRYPKSLIVRRFILELWFSLAVGIRLLTNRNKYDTIIAHVPPTIFCFPLFLFKKNTRLIILVADLQSIHMGRGSGIFRKIIFSFIDWIEKRAFNSSDHLIFMSDAMLNTVGRNNINQNIDVDVCYPGVTIRRQEKRGNDSLNFIQNSNKNIVYSGALGEKQNPEFLYRLFNKLAISNPEINFYILSEGDLFEKIKKMGEAQDTRVKFLPLVNEDNVIELYSKSTVQIVPQKPGTSDGSLPSKVPNLMSNYVPIFAVTDAGGDLANLLEKYPLGYHTQSSELSHVEDELLKFVNSVEEVRNLSDDQKSSIDIQLRNKFSFEKFLDTLVLK